MTKTSSLQAPSASCLLELFRAARASSDSAFVAACYEWLNRFLTFDVLLLARAPLSDVSLAHAHLHGLPDPKAAMESYARVAHLDVFAPRVIERLGTPVPMDWDAPEIAAPSHDPYRAHLLRHGMVHGGAIALLREDGNAHVMATIRGTVGKALSQDELAILAELAPYLAEAMIQRWTNAWLNSKDLAFNDVPSAIVDAQGVFKHMTNAFVERYRRHVDVKGYLCLSPECMAELAIGRPWPLGDDHCLYATRDRQNWLLRVARKSRLDQLGQRERQVAQAYVKGSSYTEIAAQLGIAPATVRRHLSNIYTKLRVTHRVELMKALSDAPDHLP